MRVHRFVDRDFHHIGRINPERDERGAFLELLPQARYRRAASTPLHSHGSGPFCRFRIGRDRHEAGLYVLTLDDNPVYAGECVDLGMRWGPNGYGGISPRNCFRGGQPTNCRVNAAILVAVKEGRAADLWFCPLDVTTEDRRRTETELIQLLAPPWNLAKMNRTT